MTLTYTIGCQAICEKECWEHDSQEGYYARSTFGAALRASRTIPQALPAAAVQGTKAERRKWQRENAREVAAAKWERERAMRRAVVHDTATEYGFDADSLCEQLDRKETAGFIGAFIIWVVGGPEMLFLTVVCAVVGWVLEEELHNHYGDDSIAECAAAYCAGVA